MTQKQQMIERCNDFGIRVVSRDTIESLRTKIRSYLIENPNPGFWECITRKQAKLTRLVNRRQKPRKAQRLLRSILRIVEDHYGNMTTEFLTPSSFDGIGNSGQHPQPCGLKPPIGEREVSGSLPSLLLLFMENESEDSF